jgi:tyrosine-specific transport protein
VDPVMALKEANPASAPLVECFSFLAIVTSFIGFILGLSDFLQDALPMPSRDARLPAYALTLLPPYFLAMLFPDIFFAALDTVRPLPCPIRRLLVACIRAHLHAS